MKVALLIPDNRDEFREFGKSEPEFGPAPAALLAGLARLPDVEVHVISCVHHAMNAPAWLSGGRIRHHQLVVPAWGWLRSGYLGCLLAIRRKLRELLPDIVHGQGTERYCGLAAVWSGFPNVLTIHGNMRAVARVNRARPGSFLWLAARLEGFTLPRSGGVLCNSAYTESLVRPVAREVWRVPNAVRDEFFTAVPATRSEGRPVLLCVGVIQERKRQVALLDWALGLRKTGRDFELRFIGAVSPQDPYAAEFLRRATSQACIGWVTHLSTWDTRVVVQEMDRAGALIHFPTEEAFGLVVAEGLARNIKFFGARVGGVSDIANDVEGAELIAADDWQGLASAVDRWFSSGLPHPTGSVVSIRRRFHPDVIASQHLEIYRELFA